MEFWDCYEYSSGSELLSRDWLVPGPSDILRDDAQSAPPTRRLFFTRKQERGSLLAVHIRERCSEGVLNDVIGGEIWEASFLLCAYILLHLEQFSAEVRVLELGAGVSLPSLLLLELRRRSEEGNAGELVLTDNDGEVLDSLHLLAVEEGGEDCPTGTPLSIRIRFFDWQYPTSIDPSSFDVVIGSALVYSPEHASALSKTLSHLLLSPGSAVKQVVVVQISDRPGFARLLRLLSNLKGVSFSAHTVGQDVYDLAQQTVVHSQVASGPGTYRRKTVFFPPHGVEGTRDHIRTERENFTVLTVTRE
jgi:predicted nicotinamide N-methyase